ncbi:flagellar hook-associated protein 3, putative [Heliomicrobium modesticaldum Ice1]|uniref:Flagellar hook-associated protein 3, putative n=1 Tax=Heliobacterium modesticaldum (strain ATCC 51547 / Ice1) TaxID=498761 RepID=B0TH43_HELMI|nr:flagellar hook-associated protein FlgL [Heliomicrobium modesticaldum]ABZ83368.1 flagellar hook-associated protein 3, putative [Heliomicrobium modesticaldum Ice1]
MRVTQAMMSKSFLTGLYDVAGKMDKTQFQLSTGRQYRLPEDAPMENVQIMTHRSTLVQVNKYMKNTSEIQTWLENSDSALSEVNNVLQRVRELILQADNGTTTTEAKKATADEISELNDHLKNVSNTTIAGRYIFAGTNTDRPPCAKDTNGYWKWNGNNGDINVEIDAKAVVAMNSKGTNVFVRNDFNWPGSPVPEPEKNLFNFLDSLTKTLKDANTTEDLDTYLAITDKFLDGVNEERASVGARANRIDFTKSRLEEFQLHITEALSDREDADMAQVYTNMRMQENVFRAALSAGARIIQPSLVDFLR